MPLGSVDYENATFRACYGSQHSAAWPDSFTVHLFEGYVVDPTTGDLTWTELAADGGYVPPTVANDDANFPAPTDGTQDMPAALIEATGPFNATAYYAGLKDPSGVLVEYVRLAEPLDVVAAGEVQIPLSFWHDNDDEG